MDWLLLCPMCACVVESFDNLRGVDDHYHCPMCRCDYVSGLDEFIAVTFTVAPAVRPIAYHHRSALTAEDYFFECRMTPDGLRPDGTPMIALLRGLSHGVHDLPPGSVTRYDVEASEGFYFGADVDSRASFEYRIDGPAAAQPQLIPITYNDGCTPANLIVAPGKITFEVTNTTGRAGMLAICSMPPRTAGNRLTFAPFLSGGRLLVTQSFRVLFRNELIRTEGIGVRDVTLLFTDLKGSTALYERLGDLKAFGLVQAHFERIRQVTVANGGAIIKTIGDAVMAAFEAPADAVRAGLQIRDDIERFNHSRRARDMSLRIGVHRGPSIAVTLNERLDYFGQTVNVAARIQGCASGDEIGLSDDVYEAPGVRELLAPYAIARQQVDIRGAGRRGVVIASAAIGGVTA